METTGESQESMFIRLQLFPVMHHLERHIISKIYKNLGLSVTAEGDGASYKLAVLQ